MVAMMVGGRMQRHPNNPKIIPSSSIYVSLAMRALGLPQPCFWMRGTATLVQVFGSCARLGRSRWIATNTLVPPSCVPYVKLARWDRPIGSLLLYFPCSWSIALATPAGHVTSPSLLALVGVGAVVMRGAGCTINDLWDKNIDKRVQRTKDRPLASNQVSPLCALGFLSAQMSVGLAVLLSLHPHCIVLGATSLLPVVVYPLMKRFTYWPQLFLGLTFNWGALLGGVAVKGAVPWSWALPLYGGSICWTLVYDTIYAHQDKSDDILVNVKSTALLFRDQTPQWLYGFATGAAGLWSGAGVMAGQTWPYYTAVATAWGFMVWQIRTVNFDNTQDCWRAFTRHKWVGLVILGGAILGTYLREKAEDEGEVPQHAVHTHYDSIGNAYNTSSSGWEFVYRALK